MIFLRSSLLSALLFYSAIGSAQAVNQPDDELLFACESFPRDFTEDDLRARFGAENVIRDQVTFFDDGPQETTVVFPDDPSRRLFITWSDLENGTGPGGVRISDFESRWRNVDGLSVGDTLLAVEEANGWPFRLNALTFEGGGRVRNWGEGRLTDLESELPECRMVIGFGFRANAALDPLLVRQVSSLLIRDLSPRGLSSGHPALRELNPVIDLMVISYPLIR
jgi:hypothetical protein